MSATSGAAHDLQSHCTRSVPACPMAAATPFLLLAQRAGGSTWMAEQLDSHADVSCNDELLTFTNSHVHVF